MVLGFTLDPAVAATDSTSCAVPSIGVAATGRGIVVTGRALALAPCRFEASLHIERSGTAGHVVQTQAGSFDVAAGEAIVVATAGVSMEASDTLEVELMLSVDGRQIASSALHVGG